MNSSLLEKLKPSDFKLDQYFSDSAFRNTETETIARNIVVISAMMAPDAWTPFTWEKYCELCKRESGIEHGVLEALVNGGKPVWNTTACLQSGYLEKNDDDEYSVTGKFLSAVAKFVK